MNEYINVATIVKTNIKTEHIKNIFSLLVGLITQNTIYEYTYYWF